VGPETREEALIVDEGQAIANFPAAAYGSHQEKRRAAVPYGGPVINLWRKENGHWRAEVYVSGSRISFGISRHPNGAISRAISHFMDQEDNTQ
jgi:hypothetical protein